MPRLLLFFTSANGSAISPSLEPFCVDSGSGVFNSISSEEGDSAETLAENRDL